MQNQKEKYWGFTNSPSTLGFGPLPYLWSLRLRMVHSYFQIFRFKFEDLILITVGDNTKSLNTSHQGSHWCIDFYLFKGYGPDSLNQALVEWCVQRVGLDGPLEQEGFEMYEQKGTVSTPKSKTIDFPTILESPEYFIDLKVRPQNMNRLLTSGRILRT